MGDLEDFKGWVAQVKGDNTKYCSKVCHENHRWVYTTQVLQLWRKLWKVKLIRIILLKLTFFCLQQHHHHHKVKLPTVTGYNKTKIDKLLQIQ